MQKIHLISGGCGFVGRNLVKRLYQTTQDKLLIVDDLSTGTSPETWFPNISLKNYENYQILDKEERVLFWKGDFKNFLWYMRNENQWLQKTFGIDRFNDVYHFAAIVGGRSKIDGDPMAVALDLAIDAELFYWAVQHKPDRILYPSSSAAYPISLQTDTTAIALKETDIQFGGALGQPDMTYGWSKLTGEYLAQIAAKHYRLKVACVRPFSGYGEDQDLSYPIPAIAARAAKKEDPFEVWGSGYQGRDFVHIDDCIDCILLAINHIHDGSAINIGFGKLTTFREIIDLFCEFAGYQPTIKPLLDKPVGVHSRYADMTYVTNQFGWYPKISLREGMKRVYDASVKRLKENS